MRMTPLMRKLAKQLKKQFADTFVNIDWVFNNNTSDTYDPLTDTLNGQTINKTLLVLAYPIDISDNNLNFSSTGVFIDSPQDFNKCQILITWDELPEGVAPSVKDTFTWNGLEYNVRRSQVFPTQAIYILEAWR